jgi:hypothetical protein
MVRPSNLEWNQRCNTHSIYIADDILDVVHGADSSFSIGVLAVANETETTAAASVTVLDDDLMTSDMLVWVTKWG